MTSGGFGRNNSDIRGSTMDILKDWLIGWPERVARHLGWLAPLFARVVVGWVFLWSGWGKLNNLPAITENFVGWHIPFPQILAPFVSGVEFFGGILLLLGLMTRVWAGALARLRGFEGWGEAKLLIHREVTPKGRHYTGVTEATWAAVIFGGGCGGSANFSRSNSSFSSGSGCV